MSEGGLTISKSILNRKFCKFPSFIRVGVYFLLEHNCIGMQLLLSWKELTLITFHFKVCFFISVFFLYFIKFKKLYSFILYFNINLENNLIMQAYGDLLGLLLRGREIIKSGIVESRDEGYFSSRWW